MTIASSGHHLETPLIWCDGCGVLGVAAPRFGWKRFNTKYGHWRHHCTRCQDDFRIKYDSSWE